ncbi:MAG: hypothetical protein NTY48_04435, partial [Candidatus Diapherotrites archaeon]|nr:hypothetical protein [Candidatus Diapherotrites archaeon]
TTAVSEPVPTPTTASVVNPSTNQSVLVQSSPGVNVCMDGDTRDYDCADGKKVTWCSCIGAEWRCITAPEAVCSGAGSLACTGCENKLDKTCVSTGTRIISDLGATINPAVDRTIVETPLFCDLDKSFKEQKADGAVCQNNYECTSNTCSSGKCVNIQEQLTKQNDILQQIVDWLSKFFGLKFN